MLIGKTPAGESAWYELLHSLETVPLHGGKDNFEPDSSGYCVDSDRWWWGWHGKGVAHIFGWEGEGGVRTQNMKEFFLIWSVWVYTSRRVLLKIVLKYYYFWKCHSKQLLGTYRYIVNDLLSFLHEFERKYLPRLN